MRLLYIFPFIPLFYIDGLVRAQTDISPGMTIELAIEKAKYYAADSEIDLRGKFIKKVEYHSNTQIKNELSYW